MVNLDIKFDSLHDVHQAYMPFILPAAIFIPVAETYPLGTEITLRYALPQSHEFTELQGVVVWVNPHGGCNGRPAGVGVKFVTNAQWHKVRFEDLLANPDYLSHLTFTM